MGMKHSLLILSLFALISFGSTQSLFDKKALIRNFVDSVSKLCNDEKPEKCQCADGAPFKEISAPFGPLFIIGCRPVSCTCANGDEIRLPNRRKIVARLVNKINELCGDSAIDECSCRDSSDTLEGPLDADTIEITESIACKPKEWTCTNGESFEIPKPKFVEIAEKFDRMCEGNKPLSCLCATDDSQTPFRELAGPALLKCRPKTCECRNGDQVPVDFIGCPNGGLPGCYEDLTKKLTCSDGSTITSSLANVLENADDCACKDGKLPKCGLGGPAQTCPDGSAPNIDELLPIIAKCDRD